MHFLILPRNLAVNGDNLEMTVSLCYGGAQEVNISVPLTSVYDTPAVFAQAIKDSALAYAYNNWQIELQSGEEAVLIGMPV